MLIRDIIIYVKRLYYYNLIILLIISIFIIFIKPNFIFADIEVELKNQINQKTDELKRLEEDANRIKEELIKTTGEKESLNRELSIINSERRLLENNISQTKNKIDLLRSEIKKTEIDIKDKNIMIGEQSNFLELLLRRVDEQENISILESFLSSELLSDFLKKRDQYITLQDPIIKKTVELRANKLRLFSSKLMLKENKNKLDFEKEKFYDQKTIVVYQEDRKKDILEFTQNKESIYQKNLIDTKKRISALDKQIRDFESKLKFLLNKNSIPEKGSEVFEWPLPKKDIYITQRFGKTTSSGILYASGSHSGVDFRAAIGTPVYSVSDGVIIGTGNTDEACVGISFGKWILIEHGNIGLSTTYGHLSKIKLKDGDHVKKGDLIGYSGNTGHTTGPHLHITTYATYNNNNKKVVKIIKYDSWTCPGKSIIRPSAPIGAYLNPIDFFPKLSENMFKHPRL